MTDALLTIDNVVKRFDDATILDGISFSVKKSEVIVIVGPSGCGKSTLLRCINALEPIQEGSITLDGDVIERNSKTLPLLRQRIGMVFQSYDLFPHLTVLDNILLAPCKVQKRDKEEVKQEAMSLLERVGLKEKAKSYPRELSGGQKQRVAIAGVIAMEPKCIVLDEPTAMLDPNGRKEVLQAVARLRKEKNVTVILITHYMEEVIDADQVFVMDSGHIVMHGTPREIFGRADELKSYRMDVPQVTMLAEELRKRGLDIPKGILRREELVEALCRLR